MTTQTQLPSVDALKRQAKALRSTLARDGQEISHARALELIAHQHGARDWNTLHAAAGNSAPELRLGGRVTGRYLGHAFAGEILAVSRIGSSGWHGVTVKFDDPIDVVASPAMSSYRRRVHGIVDAAGRTAEKTSDGVPHLVLDL